MNQVSLDRVLKFIELTHALQKVIRSIRINGEDRWENDFEHQYQLALLAWYLIESEKIDLDLNKVIKYSLIHDFVEVYAGDVYFYGNREGKEKKEREAAEKLKKEFPEFSELHDLIGNYEKKEDKESRFVYALDKLLPVLNIYIDGGRTWKELNVNLEMIINGKSGKIHLSPEVEVHFKEIIPRLREKEKELFG